MKTWSDHRSFWRSGYAAMLIQPTASYSYPFYHSREDTPDKLDFNSMTIFAEAIYTVVNELSNPST
jgi:hypothetical protein